MIESPPIREILHYPLAIEPWIARGMERAKRLGYADEFIRHVDLLLESPAMQYRPLPQALRFHKSEKKFRYALGGNRSSKSHSSCMETYYFVTGFHPFQEVPRNSVGWSVTLSWDKVGDILWEKFESLLGPLLKANLAKVNWHNRGRNIPNMVIIQNPTGYSKIIFKAYEQGADNFQGTDRAFIHADEQMPQPVYIEMISRIGSNYPLRFWSAMTPIKPQPWLEERLTANVPAEYDVFEYPLDDNRISAGGFIADSEIDRIIEEWPEEVQPTRRNGKWGSFAGSVYKSFSRLVHVVQEADERKFFPNEHFIRQHHSRRGIDFGAADPFACLWAVKIPHLDNAWYIYDEYWWDSIKKGAMRLMSDHAKAILAVDEKWGCAVLTTWADHDKQDRFELNQSGVMTQPARKEPILNGLEACWAAMKWGPTHPPHFYIAARCMNTIREIPSYKWPDVRPKRNIGDLPIDKNNHGCDIFRYIIFSEKVSAPPTTSMPGGRAPRRLFQ